MKKVKYLLTFLMVFILMFACSVNAFAAGASDTLIEVKDENNLAVNKWDWATDVVGSATVEIDNDGMRFENFETGSSSFAIYKTKKTNEFKLSMYMNLHLTRPTDKGMQDEALFDYANVNISFMVAAETPYPTYVCPWSANNCYFYVTFENLQGNPITQLWRAEGYAGNGAQRKAVVSINTVPWNDREYHWYEIEVKNATQSGETGKMITFYFDGTKGFEYFQKDKGIYSDHAKDYVDVDFTNTSGYFGFWPSSDFPVGTGTQTSECYIQIDKIKMVSYDGQTEETYVKAPKPAFDIETASFSAEASYDTGSEIEIKLSELFLYEGDDALTYTVTSGGEDIGIIRNGYWVWTPTTAGNYDIDVKAENEDGKSAVNYLTLIVKGETVDEGSDDETSGCGSSIAISGTILSLVAIGGSLVALKKKR